MYVDVNDLKRIACDISMKKNQCKTNNTAFSELPKLWNIINDHLQESELEKACNWMLYENLWL